MVNVTSRVVVGRVIKAKVSPQRVKASIYRGVPGPPGSGGGGGDVSLAAVQALIAAHVALADPHPVYQTLAEVQALLAAHENAADPHAIYQTLAEVQALLAAHENAADPHPAYQTLAEVQALLADHEAAADPHPVYVTKAMLQGGLPFTFKMTQVEGLFDYLESLVSTEINFARMGGQLDLATQTKGLLPIAALPFLTGDLSSTNGSNDVSIRVSSVTLDKLADMPPFSVLGNGSAVTDGPQHLFSGDLTELIDVFSSTLKGAVPPSGGGAVNYLRADGTWAAPAGGGGGVSDGDKGDITVSASGATWTIDNGAVTNAKQANMANGTVKGNRSGADGPPVDYPFSQMLDLIGITHGGIMYRNASTWIELAPGTAGQVLKTNGTGFNPAWGSVAIADVTGLQTALDGKSATGHTHAIADVSGLQAALDAKLDDSQATTFGLSLLDDADAATARTTLGLGTAATSASTAFAAAGHTHLLAAGATDVTITAANLNLLDDGGDTTLHFHAADRARANHTGTQTAATISDFSASADARIAAASINALSDVVITSPATGQVIKYNGTNWINDTDATGGGGVSDGDKGDITVSASGATWTIDNGAVTYAKMQNVSATARVLGRATAGAGVVEELTAAQVKTLIAVAIADVSGLQAALDAKLDDGQATTFGLSLLDDADATAARATLGLGTAATSASTAFAAAAHTHVLAAGATDVTITAANLNVLDDGADTTLHFHAADRARANHTGTQTASTISDFSASADARIAAASINALSDVVITSPATGQVIKYNGTNWINDTDATGGGGVSDGDKGDITVSASGATWTIDNGAVTNAKQANMANGTVKGNRSGADGPPVDYPFSQMLDLIGITHGGIMYRNASTWIELAPGTAGQVLQTNGAGAGPTWVAPGGGPDSRATRLATDFSHANAVQDDFIMAAVASGTFSTAAVAAALSPNHPGVIQPRSSTTTNSGVQCMTLQTAFRIAGGEQWDFNFFTAPVLTTINMRSGAFDSATVTAPVDGVYFEMASSGDIVGKCRNNSTESATATLATLAASTWYHGRISVNAAGTSVTFTVYSDAGAVLGTANLTTNIPTAAGREVGWGSILTSSGTTAIELGHWDRMMLTNPGRVVARGAA